MSEASIDPLGALRAEVAASAAELHGGSGEDPSFERPPRPELGDFSTNAALLTAPLVGSNPRELAGDLGERLRGSSAAISGVEVAGPGFLNIAVTEPWLRESASAICRAGERFGSGVAADRALRILVEFVSANPTGPLTVASARHAAYGDSLCRVLEFAGHAVEREYYLNDAGAQIRLFGESIAARMRGGAVPEGGYEGAYVGEIASELQERGLEAADPEQLAGAGVELVRERIAADLDRVRVRLDRWSSERDLRERDAIAATLELLRERDLVYSSEDALWLRTGDLGDDKDRVLVRADGEPTYFAADIAYHRDKLDRGYERLVDVLGADHHGYVARMRAAVEALGAPPETFEAPIIQLVHLLEGGERAQMSKRRGEFATLEELVDDIGVDAARFFLVQRSHETPLDLDLELARKRHRDNPVYYVQYAHARIRSIFREAAKRGLEAPNGPPPSELGEPMPPSERALILRLIELPDQVARAEQRREPHGLGAYAREVAADFHAFYRDCPVLAADDEARGARLQICEATATVIATVLGLLGIEAPEEM
jgi:arginyl-tRNA synthetase